ncbi:MAG: TRAP transporter substrate-binding protein [Aquamicrobium sp.]|nr:TRAP transporter substrate-binding protein [Aquamicrobium sp.]
MTRLTRRTFVAAGAGLLAMPALIRRAQAQKALTVASLMADDKPETQIWLRVRDLVEERLPGRFAFNIVGNAALGGEKEVAEMIRLGAVQASLSTVSALSGWVPEAQLLDLPFLFRDAAHLRAAVAGETGERLRERFAAEHFVVPAFIDYGARHLLAKEKLTRPAELRGLRIRVIQSPLHTKLWSAFGATPVGIPIPETYNALQTGVADAMDLTKSAYAGFRLYEVVPHLVETGHIRAAGVVYFSAPFWNGLSDEEREVFGEAARAGAAHFDALVVADEARAMEIAAAHGGTVSQPEAREEWEAGARTVWADFADTVGGMERIEAVRDLAP